MRNKFIIGLSGLIIFLGGFFLGRWVEGKRQAAICQTAVLEAEKRQRAENAKVENDLNGKLSRCWDAYVRAINERDQ